MRLLQISLIAGSFIFSVPSSFDAEKNEPVDFNQISVGPLKNSGKYVQASDWQEIDEDKVEKLVQEINRVPIDAFVQRLGDLKAIASDGSLHHDRISYRTNDGDKRSLYCAAIRVNAPLGKILKSLHQIDHFRKSRPDFVELHVLPGSYMKGRDKLGNPVWSFQFQVSRSDIPGVGARSARIRSVFQRIGNSVRVDSHLVPTQKNAFSTFKRVDTAALIIPVGQNAHLVLLAQDINPRKKGENRPLLAGRIKQREVNLDLIHIKKQSEQEE